MNIESLKRAFFALGALESWVDSAAQAEIEGAQAAKANLVIVEAELLAARDLFLKAQGLLGA
jgi:hypothetical protein